MIDIATSKEQVRCYLEKGDGDGGEVVVYLKALPDGSYASHREWFSDPTMAKSEYAAVDAVKAGEKLVLIDAKIEPIKEPTVKGG